MKFNRRSFLFGVGTAALLPGATLSFEGNEKELNLPMSNLRRICFGSCNRQKRDQSHWDTIASLNPDLFLMLGDNIYGDTDDMEELRRKYSILKNNPHYKNFRSQIPIRATWDDHDYGENNAGSDYPMRRQSQQAFCDFFNIARRSPRRTRSGIYDSFSIGEGREEVKVILLDTRFNRDRRKTEERDILGEEQWRWFENELRTSTAKVHLICSSISVLNTNLNVTEDWGDFPYAEAKLWDLMETYRPETPVFLSGDKHFGGVFARRRGVSQTKYVELMSSGLTHAVPGIFKPVIRAYYKNNEIYLDKNFGSIDFNFEGSRPELFLKIHDIEGGLQRGLRWPIAGE